MCQEGGSRRGVLGGHLGFLTGEMCQEGGGQEGRYLEDVEGS